MAHGDRRTDRRLAHGDRRACADYGALPRTDLYKFANFANIILFLKLCPFMSISYQAPQFVFENAACHEHVVYRGPRFMSCTCANRISGTRWVGLGCRFFAATLARGPLSAHAFLVSPKKDGRITSPTHPSSHSQTRRLERLSNFSSPHGHGDHPRAARGGHEEGGR